MRGRGLAGGRPLKDCCTLAVDAMGGDAGLAMTIPGVRLALQRHDDLHVLLFGDSARVEEALRALPADMRGRVRVRHAEVAVRMDEKPSQALRKGRRVSSMWLALEAVKKGEAHAAVSAGNTGALMAMSVFVLKTMPGIKRPAIAGLWPTTRGHSIVLDLGATIGADAEQLVDYAIMGEAMARALLHVEQPSVGLLNVGVEEIKGVEEVRRAGRILRQAALPIRYHGFVEGDDIAKGTVDVFVVEGFTGNIALKTAEGTARQIAGLLKKEMMRDWLSRLGALLARRAFRRLKEKLDPRESNGGIFLGLNGIVVKSHGGTDEIGFANALTHAREVARHDLISTIAEDLRAKKLMGDLARANEENGAAAPEAVPAAARTGT